MTHTRTCQARFMDNNYNTENGDDVAITKSSELAAFPASNARNTLRSRVWKPAGNFTVTTSNRNLYINDGSDKTVTLTAGSYTYSTLASHIQTQLNSSSSSWVCTYDFSGGTFKFTINRTSGTKALRFSQTSNAAWDMLGYTQTADSTSGPWVAEEQRNHTEEWYLIDCKAPLEVLFAAVIGPISEAFSVSQSGTIKIQANNINSWSSPEVDQSFSLSDRGAFKFLDDLEETDRIYRYWRIYIQDRLNPIGPEGFKIGHIYVGDYRTLSLTNVARGFTKTMVDPSDKSYSESGSQFTNVKSKYRRFSQMAIQNISGDEHRTFEQVFVDLGVGSHFYFSLDPTLFASETLDELTFYALFENAPTLRHLHLDYYQVVFDLREAV